MLKNSKKTQSQVKGDPLPQLLRTFPAAFAEPVAAIFNKVNGTVCWPRKWKTEYLTIIPKTPNPTDLSECRNISCTSVLSKILENRVLEQLRGELIGDSRQYGGAPKCGAEHLLIELWDKILHCVEGGGNAAVLLGVDFEKAFNRMDHGVCLTQLKKLGASDGSLALVESFLKDRRMTFSIDDFTPEAVPILRGSPQGSVLGCLLYCVTTQSLTDDLDDDGQQEAVMVDFYPHDRRSWERNGPGADGLVLSTGGKLTSFKYIDDTTLFEPASMEDAVRHISAGPTVETFENLRLGPAFHVLKRKSEEIGMRINTKKTQLLGISPRNGCLTRATLNVGESEPAKSIDQLKLVGFHFGSDPGVGTHIREIHAKFKRRIWMLFHLKKAGIEGVNLYRLYCCYIRSVIEYCSPVYHPMLNGGQVLTLERIQRAALRICFGHGVDIELVMTQNGIESLESRRIRRVDSLIRKIASNERFAASWLPRRPADNHGVRCRRNVVEMRADSRRRFNSPIFFFRRRANELGL